jgi:hypothetical protein
VINAGRRSGLKIKDNLIVLANGNYPIEIDRAKFIYNQDSIKGTATVVKLDENIAEILIKGNNIFKDMDIEDIVMYK